MTSNPVPDDAVPDDAVPSVAARRPAQARRPGAPARAETARAATPTVGAVRVAAALDPIARVAVDVPLAHLDRLFDYLVPATLGAGALPGSRVRVRFAGKLTDGFVVERVAGTEHAGRLAFVERVVSPEVVLAPEVYRLARATADHWAGTLADVLRLAVPPRHAQAEAASRALPTAGAARPMRPPAGPADQPATSGAPTGPTTGWAGYRAGAALLGALAAGRSPRAVVAALPGAGWPAEIAELLASTTQSGRGALVVVPDGRDAARVDVAVRARLGVGRHVVLTADLGPSQRYRRFLEISRGEVAVVVGTRAAAFAPVRDLGLVVIWDDGDDLHAELRAPYPHARDVLMLRAHLAGAAAVVIGHAVTAEGARLVASGWAKLVRPERAAVRARAPRVEASVDPAGERQPSAGGRLPSQAWNVAHTALNRGIPVLVQVPRRGYLPALACESCRTPLRCSTCAGPLAATSAGTLPSCRWCGRLATGWCCAECGGTRFRATVVGARRTAEELGRAFPGVAVRTSAQGQVLDLVPAGPSLVIATPGAEPVAAGGYGAALLLDGWALLGRADLRAGEETLRRWLNAAALVRPAGDGGRVVVLADGSLRPVQALVRWDPYGHAERELAERTQLGFPPAVTFAELTGPADAVDEVLAAARLPSAADVLGPVPLPSVRAASQVRALVRVPRADGAALSVALHEAQGVRSARKHAAVRVRIDPIDLG